MAIKNTVADCLEHDFPVAEETESGSRVTWSYQGPASILNAGKPSIGQTGWGSYSGEVTTVRFEPMTEHSAVPQARLIVEAELRFDLGGGTVATGALAETSYEIEWVTVSEDIRRHVYFASLTDQQWADFRGWENEQSPDLKKDFRFDEKDSAGNPTGTIVDLSLTFSTNQLKLPKLVLQGVDSFPLYAPVARRIRSYVGGPPPTSSAGLKETPPGAFPNLPTGWEWVKSADRAIRQARASRWTRTEEWTGADKVLVDRNDIYI